MGDPKVPIKTEVRILSLLAWPLGAWARVGFRVVADG